MTEWQDISTAPRDGTEILAFQADGKFHIGPEDHVGTHLPAWAVVSWKDGYWDGYYSGLGPLDAPTHWMPLPPPPNEKTHDER